MLDWQVIECHGLNADGTADGSPQQLLGDIRCRRPDGTEVNVDLKSLPRWTKCQNGQQLILFGMWSNFSDDMTYEQAFKSLPTDSWDSFARAAEQHGRVNWGCRLQDCDFILYHYVAEDTVLLCSLPGMRQCVLQDRDTLKLNTAGSMSGNRESCQVNTLLYPGVLHVTRVMKRYSIMPDEEFVSLIERQRASERALKIRDEQEAGQLWTSRD